MLRNHILNNSPYNTSLFRFLRGIWLPNDDEQMKTTHKIVCYKKWQWAIALSLRAHNYTHNRLPYLQHTHYSESVMKKNTHKLMRFFGPLVGLKCLKLRLHVCVCDTCISVIAITIGYIHFNKIKQRPKIKLF